MIREERSIMGMPVVVLLGEGGTVADAEAVFAWLHEVDERFSTYKPSSEISRINAGELVPADYSDHMREILEMCEAARISSGGYFNIWNGTIKDPSGLVKGWAIERAGELLQQRGVENFLVDVGGDMVVRGQVEGRPWVVGVRHPIQREFHVKRLELRDAGIATSGTYERGNHIYDPVTNQVPKGLHSFTVVGPSIMMADLLATIGFAMGPEQGLAYVDRQPGYSAFCITEDMQGLSTPSFAQYNKA
ncbi:MAG TPA: FAD:protein FMN transferase [Candidatus Saccharimonadia bacterium]